MPINFIEKHTISYDCDKIIYIPYSGDVRRCRFCKRIESDGVSFKHKAHAISESLGNHNLLYEEECDDCNQNLSNLEQNLTNFVAPLLLTHGIKGKPKKGKNDVRGIKTESLEINNREGLFIADLNKQLSDQIFPKNNRSNGLQSLDSEGSMKWHKYKCANVYRTLCKFVISTVSFENLYLFDKTIDWIKGQIFDLSNCISFYLITNDFVKSPRIITSILTSKNEEVVLVFSFFRIANILFAYEVPLFCRCSNLTKEKKLEIFNAIIKCVDFQGDFRELNLHSEEYTCNQINFSLVSEDLLKCGKDYFVINSKELIEKFLSKDLDICAVISKGPDTISEFTKCFLEKNEEKG